MKELSESWHLWLDGFMGIVIIINRIDMMSMKRVANKGLDAAMAIQDFFREVSGHNQSEINDAAKNELSE